MKHWLKLLAQSMVIAAAIGLGPASVAAGAASPIYIVDDDGAQCPSAAYTNAGYSNPLQAAITDAIANSVKTVSVCGGVYQRVFVNNANVLTIKAFDPSIRPEIDAPAANDWDYVIQVVNSKNVVLDGLLITRTLSGDAAGGLMYGIKYYGSSGTIQNNIIRDMANSTIPGTTHGEAIVISNQDPGGPSTAKITIKNNLLDRFASQGINVSGRVSMTIAGNVLNGGGGGGGQPFYGIEVTGGTVSGTPSGKISQNNINDTYNGIYLQEVGGLSINGNVITGVGWAGVTVYSRCLWESVGSDKNKISGNSILRSGQYAIYIVTEEGDPTSVCDPHADQTLVSKNKFTATHLTQSYAILMIVYQYGSVYTAGISKTQIIGNQAWGFYMMSSESGNVSATVLKSNTVVRP